MTSFSSRIHKTLCICASVSVTLRPGPLTDQLQGPAGLAVLLHQLPQPQLPDRQRPEGQPLRPVQFHAQRGRVEVLHEAVVHAHHVARGEVEVRPGAAVHHRCGVQLRVVEAVGAEEGGGLPVVAQGLQGGGREGGAPQVELQDVLSALQEDLWFLPPGRGGGDGGPDGGRGGVGFEDVGFGAVGHAFELD